MFPAAGLPIEPDKLAAASGRVASNIIITQHTPVHQQSTPTAQDRLSYVQAEAGRKSAFVGLLAKDLAGSRQAVPHASGEATSKSNHPIPGSQSKTLDPPSRYQGTGREMRQHLMVLAAADARGSVTSSSVDNRNTVIQRKSAVASLCVPTTGAPQAKNNLSFDCSVLELHICTSLGDDG